MSKPGSGHSRGANLFVVHTAFQRLIVDHMLRSMPELDSVDNILVFDCNDQGVDLCGKWRTVLRLDPPVGGSVVGSGKNCRKAIRAIFETIDGCDKVNLYLSDIDWPLNNALFGMMKRKTAGNPVVTLCNFPDGLGSLIIAHPNWYQLLKNIVKSSLSVVGGAPYYLNRGDRMGLEVADKIYSLMPSALPESISRRILQIPIFKPRGIKINPAACLFVGQCYEQYMSDAAYSSLCRRAADFTTGLGYKKLLYKAHPHASSDIEINEFVARGFEVLGDKRSVEEMFMSEQTGCVVSYNSSALVHLRLMFGDKIRCISFCGRLAFEAGNSRPEAAEQVLRLFKQSGVDCCE